MARTRRTGTTHRITSLPRRLYYKTKHIIMTPVRKARARNTTTTASPNTTNNRRKHSKLFGGFQRGNTKQTQPAHRKRGFHFLGFTVKKDPNYNNRNYNHNHKNHDYKNHNNRRHRTIKSKIRSLFH